jgi:sulfide:quinone oxidoreductase
MKAGFEKYFLMKMRLGWTIPWLEYWGFRAIGLPLVEPIEVVAERLVEALPTKG